MSFKWMIARGIALAVVGVAALSWAVMALWNWLLPTLFFGAHEVNYAQAVGLLVLSRILFGGFHGRGGWHRRWHQHRWAQMTPEEREKFQAGIDARGWRRC